jgi:hypothetical protein
MLCLLFAFTLQIKFVCFTEVRKDPMGVRFVPGCHREEGKNWLNVLEDL